MQFLDVLVSQRVLRCLPSISTVSLLSCSSFTVICTMSAGDVSALFGKFEESSDAQFSGDSHSSSELPTLKSASESESLVELLLNMKSVSSTCILGWSSVHPSFSFGVDS